MLRLNTLIEDLYLTFVEIKKVVSHFPIPYKFSDATTIRKACKNLGIQTKYITTMY